MVNHPLVSVMMPAYNAEKYIGTAIESVLAQTYENWELIIVDDGSTDNTYEVATKYKDQRIKVVKHDYNAGLGEARNTALRLAQGQWATWLDSDDAMLPQRIERLIEEADSEDFFVGDLLTLCKDVEGKMEAERIADLPWLLKGKHKAIVTVEQYLRAGAPGMQQLFPMKPVIEYNLHFGDFQFGEDLDFRLQLFHSGLRLKLISESFYLYRIRPDSASRRVHPDALAMYRKWLDSNTLTPLEHKYLKRLKVREEARLVCYPVLDNLLHLQIKDALAASLKEPQKLFLLLKYVPTLVTYRISRQLMIL